VIDVSIHAQLREMSEVNLLDNVVHYRVCISEMGAKQLDSVSSISSQIYRGTYFVLTIGRNRELMLGRSMKPSGTRGNWLLK
jgi:hypothetical protein